MQTDHSPLKEQNHVYYNRRLSLITIPTIEKLRTKNSQEKPKMVPSIRIIGSLNVDMVSVTPRFPEAGETLTSTSFSIHAGGKGANQAVACGRLSRPKPTNTTNTTTTTATTTTTTTTITPTISPAHIHVEMLGATGQLDTHFTTLLQPTLHSSGVHTSRIRQIPNAHTGVAVIIVDTSAGGENRILYSPGSNYAGMQCAPDVLELSLSLTPAVPDVLVLQAEIPTETVVGILRGVNGWREARAKVEGRGVGMEADVEVVFNPAPAPEGGLPVDVYAAVDHLVMNETECEIMAPAGLVEEGAGQEKETAATSPERRDRIARHFHALGVRHVIVTLGAKGVWYSAGDAGRDVQERGQGEGDAKGGWVRFVGEVPAAKVEKVVDTTAAGDTFVGGYSVQIARWKEARRAAGRGGEQLTVEERQERYGSAMEQAVRWATRASARCVERSGAMDSIPWEDEI
ncbi:ribokinase [Blastomyces dermatitidis ER-3]|uniref:Ribokinase n=1 Tax=Ajellomyces dermatitidis (strain ER-3 / ATCC MYA-2586) TaxID=559297 RepID=A0ABP2EYS6_AJEDR|nr:ribokinase [Blastomyces dermatitidis ER-3]EEQ89393.2 ribokinase [Blastomyces dermatitidis ER-3]